jgi:hypothetical protein
MVVGIIFVLIAIINTALVIKQIPRKNKKRIVGFSIENSKGELIAFYDIASKESIMFKGYKTNDIKSYDELMDKLIRIDKES